MAIYFEKEQLKHSLKLAKRKEDIKGIQGEINVGNLLNKIKIKINTLKMFQIILLFR